MITLFFLLIKDEQYLSMNIYLGLFIYNNNNKTRLRMQKRNKIIININEITSCFLFLFSNNSLVKLYSTKIYTKKNKYFHAILFSI